MTKILKLEENYDLCLEEIVSALKKGKVVIYPTDTVYGIGADATNKKAVERIYKIKKRPREKELSVLLSDIKMLKKHCIVEKEDIEILLSYLPGPYTFVLKKSEKSDVVVGRETIAIRIPHHFFIRKAVELLGNPIITTSSNISGGKNPSSVEEIDKEILKSVDLVIDGGETAKKQHSTVVDLLNKKVLRKGAGAFTFLK